MKKKYTFAYIVLIVILLSIIMACSREEKGTEGKGASEPAVVREGRFLDSAVLGLHYSSGDHTGITDRNGTFQYEEGKTVKFSLGKIIFGEATGKPIITPIDLVPNGSVSHPGIINICRFLLTLDADADPNNGIEIPEERAADIGGIPLQFDVLEQTFENVIGHMATISSISDLTLVSRDRAQNHLRKTLDKIAQESIDSAITGTWVGILEDSRQVSKAFLTLEPAGAFHFRSEKEGSLVNLTGRYTTDKDVMPHRLTMVCGEGVLGSGEDQGNEDPGDNVAGFYLIDRNRLTIEWKWILDDQADHNEQSDHDGRSDEDNPLHYSTWIHQSELISFPDYFPSDPEKYGVKTFQRTYGGSTTYTSAITGEAAVPGLSDVPGVSGEVSGVIVAGFWNTESMIVCHNEEEVTFSGFDDVSGFDDISGFDDVSGEYPAKDSAHTCPASGWTLGTLYDGMIIDQGSDDRVNNGGAAYREETGNKLLIDIQNVYVLQGNYEKAVIVWHLDEGTPFTELDFQGNDAALGITLPAGTDTGGCSITAFEIYGRDTGPIALGAVDPLTGSLTSLYELTFIHSPTWLLLNEDKTSHPFMVTDRTFPDVGKDETAALTASNNTFAFRFYKEFESGRGNLVFSPYTFSRAMAMTCAGAAGETARQIQVALHFEDQTENLHTVFNVLDLNLKNRELSVLQTETAAWGQTGYFMHIDFYNLLAENYCQAIRSLDFKSAMMDSADNIEKWIMDHTGGLFSLHVNPVTDRVRWACAAAADLTGTWAQPFDPNATSDGTFELDSYSHTMITVPMMTQEASFPFTEDEQYQAIELAFKDSNLAMLLLIPESNHYQEFEASLNSEKINRIIDQLDYRRIALHLPLFSFTCGQGIESLLSSLGIHDARAEGMADFSAINELDDLYLNGSTFMAHISVKEAGVRCAGATAVTLEGKEEIPIPEFGTGVISILITHSPPSYSPGTFFENHSEQPKEVALSRPFIFVIRDTKSGAILFLGRLKDPRDE
ncbi:MAG: serpin family protein [bacterium]